MGMDVLEHLSFNLDDKIEERACEKYKVNFANITAYRSRTIPYCQRLLNKMEEEREERRT